MEEGAPHIHKKTKPSRSGQRKRKAGGAVEEEAGRILQAVPQTAIVSKKALDIQFPSSLVKPGKDHGGLAGSVTWAEGGGEDAKVGVLLMHGAGGSPGASEGGHLPALAEAFARRGFPCVRFDAGRLGVQPWVSRQTRPTNQHPPMRRCSCSSSSNSNNFMHLHLHEMFFSQCAAVILQGAASHGSLECYRSRVPFTSLLQRD